MFRLEHVQFVDEEGLKRNLHAVEFVVPYFSSQLELFVVAAGEDQLAQRAMLSSKKKIYFLKHI